MKGQGPRASEDFDAREVAADERDRLADAREVAADERDRLADAREVAADERDRLADARDVRADERDRAAETPEDGRKPHLDVLSAREREILGLIAEGLSNEEISARMHLSINSIKTYIRSAYRKVKIETRTQAVLWFEHGERDQSGGPPG